MQSPIRAFQGKYRFLSNFYIEPDNTNVEAEFQARKTIPPDPAILKLGPYQAKDAGQRVLLRPDWEDVKLEIMHSLVTKKFKDHPILRMQLKTTGDAEIIEGNDFWDDYWGKVQWGYGPGQNWLGKILMEIRSDL